MLPLYNNIKNQFNIRCFKNPLKFYVTLVTLFKLLVNYSSILTLSYLNTKSLSYYRQSLPTSLLFSNQKKHVCTLFTHVLILNKTTIFISTH